MSKFFLFFSACWIMKWLGWITSSDETAIWAGVALFLAFGIYERMPELIKRLDKLEGRD